MSYEFIESTKGKPLLVVSGYLYRRDRKKWRCLSKDCNARIEIVDDKLGVVPVHEHSPDNLDVTVRRKLNELERTARAAPSEYKTSLLVDSLVGTLRSEAVIGRLPNLHLLRKKVDYARKKTEQNLGNPGRTRTDLRISDSDKMTLKDDLFLHFDSGEEDPDRIIVFATSQNLSLLRECPE
ncbi:uncharacterized protein LOC100908958 [Galendromus occidentalis]|uniref:Uncharacterized protein LOC100908958 n=1 Tax=Galendromus occidentalis TaxID=34638 RepID=A0AAJ6VV20_9ACAR|nr:uncharacterized protein LOC100908958 [Galendromus occidentalis]